ncbi:MAG: hypothetical protein ACTSP4_16730 [Candidatus Hodarchaeales archaeon]
MVGIQMNSEEDLEKLNKILGLTTEQSKVYIGIMSLGTGTLGQVSTVTGLDIITTSAAMDQGFITEIPGIIRRYMFQEPFLKSFILSFDPITLIELKEVIDKRLSSSLDILDNREMFDKFILSNIKSAQQDLLDSVDGDLQPDVEKFLTVAGKKLADICYMVLEEHQAKTKKIFDKTKGEFDMAVLNLVEKIKDTRNTLREVFKMSRSFKMPPVLSSDVLIGESSIVLMIRDLITRTRRNLTIMMPQPELRSLMEAAEISQKNPSTRITVTGDLAKTPKSILKKILSESNVKIKQYSEVDFWCVIRDNEEMIFAPHVEDPSKETMIGIISQNESLIQLIQGQMQGYSIRGTELTLEKVDHL